MSFTLWWGGGGGGGTAAQEDSRFEVLEICEFVLFACLSKLFLVGVHFTFFVVGSVGLCIKRKLFSFPVTELKAKGIEIPANNYSLFSSPSLDSTHGKNAHLCCLYYKLIKFSAHI